MGFPPWAHGPLLQIPCQSHLNLYYGTHIISHIIEKNVCRTLLTVMFNWRQPMYYQGISRAIDPRLLDLTYTHSWEVTRSDVRRLSFYSPALKKWGYIGFGLSVILSFCPSFHMSVVSAQYLENNFIEFNQILYVH